MSIKRINEFPEGSGSLSNDDVFLFMDDPSGNGVTKKISLSQISSAIGGGGGGSGISTTITTVSYSSTITVDASIADMFDIELTGNVLLDNPINPVNGKTIRCRISQDNSGNRTVTLGDKFVIPSSATGPLPWSTSPNKMDILAATYHAGRDKWDVVAFVPGY